ncbi:hypothetical protein QUF72_11360 [Desulfobacterales bacterium HSG2]|nr:hypothetical protein [Desulfobacterales bacterium HSG2]
MLLLFIRIKIKSKIKIKIKIKIKRFGNHFRPGIHPAPQKAL